MPATLPRTSRFEIRYRAAPAWEVGERTLDHRPGEHYQDDYAGKVLDVRSVDSDLPSLRKMADKTRPVVEMDLAREELAALKSRTMKIASGEPVPVTFDDRWGAIASTLRANFDNAHAAELESDDPDSYDGRRFNHLASIAKDGLPAPDVHTGTGYYYTKAVPTKNDDTQNGAPVGQVVNLTTGGLGTSDAFIGGYILNVTRTETRAIVSHNDGDATLEGNLANWLDTDDLDIYDSWSTVQGALDQLWTDQGAAGFAAGQYIRVFAGTYDEVVTPNAGLLPGYSNGRLLVIEGDPADDRDNIILAETTGAYDIYVNCDVCLVRHFTLAGTPTTNLVRFHSGCWQAEVNDCVAVGAVTALRASNYTMRVIDCHITQSAGVAVQLGTGSHMYALRVTMIGPGSGTASSSSQGGIYTSCVFSGWTDALTRGNQPMTEYTLLNCTMHNCTYGVSTYAFTGHVTVVSCIFKDCTYVVRHSPDPEEAGGLVGGRFYFRNNCYHGYTNFSSAGHTYATFAAFNRVDASGDLDATDPLLTAPGSGDFSLQAASPCRHTGHGGGVITGINDTAFDPNHPDIGAWSSGILTVAAPSITSATDKADGDGITLALVADHARDVLSVYYRETTDTSWTLFGSTRTGSGDLDITGLTSGHYHQFICLAARGGEVSLPSGPAGAIVTTGSEAATDGLSLYMENLRTLIANSATFQTLVGAADAAAAKAFIDYPAVPGADWSRPQVLIGHDDSWEHERMATQGPWRETTDLWFNIEADIPANYQSDTKADKKDAHLWFTNRLGAIISEMEVLAGTSTYLDVVTFAPEGGPHRSDEEEEAQGNFYYGQFINVSVRG